MISVKLKEPINYETLKSALVEKARERKWKLEDKDEYKKTYELDFDISTPLKESKKYNRTQFKLTQKRMRSITPVMTMYIFDKDLIDYLHISDEKISEDEIKKYMDSVSKEISRKLEKG